MEEPVYLVINPLYIIVNKFPKKFKMVIFIKIDIK